MVQRARRFTAKVVFLAVGVAAAAGVTFAQQDPVATMFRSDLKREQSLALSFLPVELPAAGGAPSLNVYLSAGDLERAFDDAAFRPTAAIVPTNTGLVITAASPSTQRVLISRVSKQARVLADLQDQIALRKKQATGDVVLQVGLDAFLAELPRAGSATEGRAAFPRRVCLIATDFPAGGAVDRRDLFAQDRVRKGVAGCLAALDAAGATSVAMPLLGAASAKSQSNDPVFEGQRLLKECRHLNAVAGIALGIHDFAPNRHAIREIGVVQWDQEITHMFSGSRLGQTAYRVFAEQIKTAMNKGIAGQKTTASDVDGACTALNPAAAISIDSPSKKSFKGLRDVACGSHRTTFSFEHRTPEHLVYGRR